MDFLDFEDEDIPALPEYSDRPAPPAKRSAAPIGAESETAKDKDKEDGQLNLTLDSDYENDDPADKAGAEGQDKPRVVRKPRVVVKLDAERMLGEDGLPKLLSNCKKLKFKGKGREKEDLDKLLTFFQLWGHDLFPKLQFKSFVERAERVCKEKRLRVFHSAVVQETKRRAQNVFVDEEELESRNFAKAVEGEALDLDKELEKAILERAREAEQGAPPQQESTSTYDYSQAAAAADDDDDDLMAHIEASREQALSLIAEKRRQKEEEQKKAQEAELADVEPSEPTVVTNVSRIHSQIAIMEEEAIEEGDSLLSVSQGIDDILESIADAPMDVTEDGADAESDEHSAKETRRKRVMAIIEEDDDDEDDQFAFM